MDQQQPVRLGVIGGSGLYHMEGAQPVAEHQLATPFGSPAAPVAEIRMDGRQVFFLPRHGQGHHLLPEEVNYRANIHALKQLGVSHILAISAVGSLREEIRPGHMVLPDQIFDRTKGRRPSTFFGDGIAGHVPFADPFCQELRLEVAAAAQRAQVRLHLQGTYVCMEGPQFSTRAESNFYRRTVDGAVIGMTALPEAKLAREAEMCYGLLAMSTDYDCWHEEEEDVSVEQVVQVMRENAATAQGILRQLVAILPASGTCACHTAARHAIITAPSAISAAAKARLALLYGREFSS